MVPSSKRPDWNRLFEIAMTQEGHFTTEQAAEAGYSGPLIAKYLANGKFFRVRRGVYRLVHYPAGSMEDLVTYWLWSDREAVFSHETALGLHQISDTLPARVHLTLPMSWRHRRIKAPADLVIHHADLPEDAMTWMGSVRVTTPAQTLKDCEAIGVSLELVEQALQQGLSRGLFSKDEVAGVARKIASVSVKKRSWKVAAMRTRKPSSKRSNSD
jgi:predicted transcriptional regulator of viral defense system